MDHEGTNIYGLLGVIFNAILINVEMIFFLMQQFLRSKYIMNLVELEYPRRIHLHIEGEGKDIWQGYMYKDICWCVGTMPFPLAWI